MTRQTPGKCGKACIMVMRKENQLCLEAWLDDLGTSRSAQTHGRRLPRRRGNRDLSVQLSLSDQQRLKAAAAMMGVTTREFAEHALEAAIVAMEEVDA